MTTLKELLEKKKAEFVSYYTEKEGTVTHVKGMVVNKDKEIPEGAIVYINGKEI